MVKNTSKDIEKLYKLTEELEILDEFINDLPKADKRNSRFYTIKISIKDKAFEYPSESLVSRLAQECNYKYMIEIAKSLKKEIEIEYANLVNELLPYLKEVEAVREN